MKVWNRYIYIHARSTAPYNTSYFDAFRWGFALRIRSYCVVTKLFP